MSIKSAVVGVGYLGQYHAEKYYRSNHTELTAVCDVDGERVRQFGKKYRTKPLTDYRELPALGVTAASVVTPTSTHFEIVSFLLERGVDVLVEKPMTRTVEEAEQLIDLARTHGRILQVGHLERFNPAFRSLAGVLNRPWFFEVRRIAPFAGRGIDVDVVMDLMIHDIDIVSYLVKSSVARIEAIGIPVLTDSVDIANARLTFENGAIANVTASRAALKSERTIRIFQPDLYISVDFEKKRMKIYERGHGDTLSGFPKIVSREHKVRETDALADEVESFLDAVRTRRAPEVTGEDGLRAIKLAEAIQAALSESLSRISAQEPRLTVVNR